MTSAAGEVSLVAQGESPFLPSIDTRGSSTSAGGRQQHSSRNNSHFLSPETDAKVNTLVSRKSGNGHNLLGDLSKTLTFAEDAVVLLSPDAHMTSYAAAKEERQDLFSHRNIVGFRAKKHRGIGTVGRYDARGPGKKHVMCNFSKLLDKRSTTLQRKVN